MRKKLSRVVCGSLAALIVCALVCGASADAFASVEKERERAARALRQGEFETAEKLYRELIAKDTKDLRARLGLSYVLLKRRHLRDAYEQATHVITHDPKSARAHAVLGSVHLASGDFNRAVESFRLALHLKDDEALAIAGLSLINLYENRASVALSGLRRAVSLDPKEPDYLFSYAQAASRAEQYREAADAYEDFLRIAPRTDADRRARIRGLISFLRYLGAQRYLYQAGGAQRANFAFELTNSRPIVNVRVNGLKTPLRFVVDTGSGMCVLSTKAAEKLNIKPIARGGLARAVGGGGRFEIVYGFLNSMQMGEARVENVPVYIREFHNQQEAVDGYIGLSVLSKYIASVDYGTREMTLVRQIERVTAAPRVHAGASNDSPTPLNFQSTMPDRSAPANASALITTLSDTTPAKPVASTTGESRSYEFPIRSTSSGFWSSSVVLDGVAKPLNFIVDTGASISVISAQLAKTEGISRYEQKTRLRVYGAAGVSEDVVTLLLPSITMGDYRHVNLSAAVLDMSAINETSGFEQTGIIGGNVLRRFRVTFDFQRGFVRLDPHTNTPAPTPPAAAPARDANITPASGATP